MAPRPPTQSPDAAPPGQVVLDQLNAIATIIRRMDNNATRLWNSKRYIQNPRATLKPLMSVRTGAPIRNCPTRADQVDRLTATSASRILEELQEPVPDLLGEKKAAIRELFGIRVQERKCQYTALQRRQKKLCTPPP